MTNTIPLFASAGDKYHREIGQHINIVLLKCVEKKNQHIYQGIRVFFSLCRKSVNLVRAYSGWWYLAVGWTIALQLIADNRGQSLAYTINVHISPMPAFGIMP